VLGAILFWSGACWAAGDPSLIGWWLLDQTGGTVATDSSGQGNHGSLVGSAEFTSGLYGGGVYLDGSEAYVAIPNILTETCTLAFWFKPDWDGSDPDDYRLFDAGTGAIYYFIGKGSNHADMGPENFGFYLEDAADTDWQDIEITAAGAITADTWYHVTVTWQFGGGPAILYLDGEEIARGENLGDFPDLDPNPRFGYETVAYIPMTNGAAAVIDDIKIFNRVLTAEEIPGLMVGAALELASAPSPEDRATDVPQDVTLGWESGIYAAAHDVYLGTNFADVNSGDASVLANPGQTETTFAPEGLLEFGQTYYWRVDEVNAPPDSTVFPGRVWSFTVEPYTYPLENVTATASSSIAAKGMTPDKTVDGSGMTGDEHSMVDSAMWLSAPFVPLPAWIQYEFDDVYKLSELWVWNSNQSVEGFVGFGAKDVAVEYSLDGVEWSSLGDMEFARAPGTVGYTPNTTVDMAGVLAKFVRLTISSSWGGLMPQVGLSEVRFYHVPIKARQPDPVAGGREAPLDVVLTWRPGREATSHDVYFSDDRDAVVDGTAPAETVSEPRFEPSGLEYGQFYYWKVNEVNDVGGAVVEGAIWDFATAEYMVVDDFEGYTDDIEAGEAIWQTWIDGLTNNTGSVVGYFEAPFAERTIVHSGKQSMPMDYNNVNSPFYSEVERTLDPVQDWTVNGVTELRLWYRGYPVAFIENADGSITMSGAGHDIYDAADDFRFAYKPLDGDGSIVARVDSLVDTHEWAKAGVMIRESLMPDARFVYVVVTPGNGVELGRRLFAGVTPETNNVAGLAAPQYVKLTRTGDIFTAQYSADGSAWQDLTTTDGTVISISMIGDPVIGLCVTSHDASQVTTAEFSEITSSGAGPWQVVAVGDDPEPGNDTDDLYLVVQDSSNNSVVITNPDPAAVNTNEWAEWKIPLSDFAGLNLKKVQKIYIGVGDRNNPQPDGAGRIFIDDIGVGRPIQDDTADLPVNGGLEDGVEEP
jgi:hypothetical protein